MGVQDYISEAEALSLTGISTKTLARFVEAGYLQREQDNDGIVLFSKKELNDLFMFDKSAAAPVAAAPNDSYNPWNTPPASTCCSADNEELTTDETPEVVTQREAAQVEEITTPLVEVAASSVTTESPLTAQAEQPKAQESVTSTYALFGDSPEEQLNKLHRIITLQEKLLDAREEEIKDLKEQRGWLRTRIEKLEDKSDKEQLILLSETQVIRKLVSAQQQKRSPLRAALEWLGIVEEQNALIHPAMIEMSKGGSEYTTMRSHTAESQPTRETTTH